MSTNLGKDVLTLPDDKYEELERLSALGYSEADMAMYFDVPGDDFSRAALDPESKINYHIRRGVLMSGALEQMGLLSDAEKGNVTGGSSRWRNGKYCIILILTKKYFNGWKIILNPGHWVT